MNVRLYTGFEIFKRNKVLISEGLEGAVGTFEIYATYGELLLKFFTPTLWPTFINSMQPGIIFCILWCYYVFMALSKNCLRGP